MKFKTLKATLIEGRKLAQIVVDYINDHYTDIDDAIRLLAAYNFDSWDRFQVQLDWEHGIETLTDESFDINNAGDYEVLMLIKQNLAKKTLERILPISSSIQVIPNAAHNKELHKKVKKYKPGITSYGGWYLHGQLENDVQYDLADFYTVPDELTRVVPHFTCIQNNQVTYTGKMIKVPHINGVYRVNVLGIDKPCVGIFWTPVYGEYEYNGMPWEHYRQSGLICYESDWEAIAHAACKEGEYYL